MSTNSTASTYISKISQDYPTAGEDNDSQGFRDNFKNIAAALSSSDADISALNLNAVRLDKPNDFGNNIISRATFQQCSTVIFDDTGSAKSGNISIVYANGSYQKIKISAGQHQISVVGWPSGQRAGTLILSVLSDYVSGAFVNFAGSEMINLGPAIFPLEISNTAPQLFELWNDGSTIYVKSLGGDSIPTVDEIIASAGLNLSAVESLTLGGTNKFTVGTTTTAPFATVIEANAQVGNIALLPNQLVVTVTGEAVLDVVGNTTASVFPVVTTDNMRVGASIRFPNAAGLFTVTGITATTVEVDPPFPLYAFNVGSTITIVNPRFSAQPALAIMKSTVPASTREVTSDFKGEIWANDAALYVTYNDYGVSDTNKIKISSDSVTQVTKPLDSTLASSATTLATMEYASNLMHTIMPYGAIIMWYGAISDIPTGWRLCDGSGNTPNLVNRFVKGAGTGWPVSATGGTADAAVIEHTHASSINNVITDPSHQHIAPYSDTSIAPYGKFGNEQSAPGPSASADTNNPYAYTSSTSTGITIASTLTIDNAGVSGVNANLPPFYALCYIMKTSGAFVALTMSSVASTQLARGLLYSQTSTAQGGVAPYTFTITNPLGGAASPLPTGTQLRTGPTTAIVDGVVDVGGAFTYIVTVTDSTLPSPLTASQTVSGTISA